MLSYLSRDFEKLKVFRISTNTQNAYFKKKLIADFVRRGLTIYRKTGVGTDDGRRVGLEKSAKHGELFVISIENISNAQKKCLLFSKKFHFFESWKSFSDGGMYFTEVETANSKYTSDLVNLYVNSIGPLVVEFAFFGAVVLSFRVANFEKK